MGTITFFAQYRVYVCVFRVVVLPKALSLKHKTGLVEALYAVSGAYLYGVIVEATAGLSKLFQQGSHAGAFDEVAHSAPPVGNWFLHRSQLTSRSPVVVKM